MTLLRLSPTQIEKFSVEEGGPFSCPRKWFFESSPNGPKIRGPQDKATALGDAVHKTIENFLAPGGVVHGPGAGEAGVLHEVALPGAALLQKLRRRIFAVETTIDPNHFSIANTPVTGRIDALAFSEPSGSGRVEVIDWKTTSVIDKYAKTAGQLRKSIQMVIYAHWVQTIRHENVDRLTHVYFQTKKPGHLPVSTEISKPEIGSRILQIGDVIEKMKLAAGHKDPDKLPANEKACNVGFGCPHRAYCPRGEVNLASLLGLPSMEEKPVANLFDDFVAGGAAPAAVAPAAPVAVVAAPAAPAAAPAVTEPEMPAWDGVSRLGPLDAALVQAVAINPPDAAKPAPQPARAGKALIITEPPAPAPQPALEEESDPVAAGAQGAPPKRGRGRPPGAANKPKPVEATAPVATAAPAPAQGAQSGTLGGAVKVNTVTIRKGSKVGMPNYSSVTIEVEMSGTVEGDVGQATRTLSQLVSQEVRKQAEEYLAALKAQPEAKP